MPCGSCGKFWLLKREVWGAHGNTSIFYFYCRHACLVALFVVPPASREWEEEEEEADGDEDEAAGGVMVCVGGLI